MACFTDAPYANWSYQFLITLAGIGEGGATLVPIVTLGCYSEMNEAEQRYQFYKTLVLRVDLENVPVSPSCFMELTDAGQYGLLNDALSALVNPAT